jgi:DNA-3-methyladenine glycosylase
MMLSNDFFAREPLIVAKELLGKVIRHFYQGIWLSAQIIEAEAYYKNEMGSHSSLGFTEKRKALFMPPGTIYMYYARGGDSLNVSCLGEGNAVLIKSGIPYLQDANPNMLEIMLKLNPIKITHKIRPIHKLCAGQTLLCRSLNLKVPQWDQKKFDAIHLRVDDVGYSPNLIIQAKRLGIPMGRDEHLLFRFIDGEYANQCTCNPLTKRNIKPGIDFIVHKKI